jgi:hypothetical protein
MGKTIIATAGNTLAPALAVLKNLGFIVSRQKDGMAALQAENDQFSLTAEDPLQLLGLACLALHRGVSWRPTDAEINELLRLDDLDHGH